MDKTAADTYRQSKISEFVRASVCREKLKLLYSFDNRDIIVIFALSHCCRFAAIELRRAKGWQMRLVRN